MPSLTQLQVDTRWTLFLDRDGVINERIPGGYVQKWEAFQWCEGSLEAIVALTAYFGRIVIVTNQQGIGKGLVTAAEVELIHRHLCKTVTERGGKIDQVYYCPELAIHQPECRKPNTGMGRQAQIDFPEIDFQHSIMVGDSISDMEFGFKLGMKTVLISGKTEEMTQSQALNVDFRLGQLSDLVSRLIL